MIAKEKKEENSADENLERDDSLRQPEMQRRDTGHSSGTEANTLPHLIEEARDSDAYCCIPAEHRFPD